MINTILKKAQELTGELNFLLKTKGQQPQIVLSRPPKEWETVPTTTDDSWKLLMEYSEALNMTACLYKGRKNSNIPLHKHPTQVESVLVEQGSIRVITKTYEKVLGSNEIITFKENESHFIEFIEDSILLCKWRPRYDEDKIVTSN